MTIAVFPRSARKKEEQAKRLLIRPKFETGFGLKGRQKRHHAFDKGSRSILFVGPRTYK